MESHWRWLRMATWIAEHLSVWIFARGVTQGSAKDGDWYPIDLKKYFIGWGHVSLNTCEWGSLPRGNAKGLGRMEPDTQAFPKEWQL